MRMYACLKKSTRLMWACEFRQLSVLFRNDTKHLPVRMISSVLSKGTWRPWNDFWNSGYLQTCAFIPFVLRDGFVFSSCCASFKLRRALQFHKITDRSKTTLPLLDGTRFQMKSTMVWSQTNEFKSKLTQFQEVKQIVPKDIALVLQKWDML